MALISAGAIALLVVVIAGAYVVIGNRAASDRLSAADSVLAKAGKIDFASYLQQTSGGFAINGSGTWDAFGFQRSVKNFIDDTGNAGTTIASQDSQLLAAKARLRDSKWLTALNTDALNHASDRIDEVLQANRNAEAIVADFQKDGDFFTAYANVSVDLYDYAQAAEANDEVTIVTKLVQLKTDVDKALPLTAAPGLPSGVHDYLAVYQTFANDFAKFASNPPTDVASQNAAATQLEAELEAVIDFDTSGFDTAIQSFYDPLISAYDSALEQASG